MGVHILETVLPSSKAQILYRPSSTVSGLLTLVTVPYFVRLRSYRNERNLVA